MQEEQRSPSVPCGLGLYSFFPNDHYWYSDYPASKSQANNFLLFNGNATKVEEFSQSATGMENPKCPSQSSAGEDQHSNSVQHYKLTGHLKLLSRINAIGLLSGLMGILIISVVYRCFDFSYTISDSLQSTCNGICTCETSSLFYPLFEKESLAILIDGKDNLIQEGLENVKNIPIHYDGKLPVWISESLYFSLSVMYLTSTPIPTPSRSPYIDRVSSIIQSPHIDLYSSPIHTPPLRLLPSQRQGSSYPFPHKVRRRAMEVSPTPPLPGVPSILNNYPLIETADFSPSLNIENQCMGVSEIDDIPSCVHDAQQVLRHCTRCHVWSCLFCSRPIFISTLGVEHLMLNPARIGKIAADTSRLLNVESSSGTSFSHSRLLYSIDLNWWQRNMMHEYVVESAPPPYPISGNENEGSDNSLTSITARMTVAVADTKCNVTSDPVMEYLNNHYYYENPPLDNCLIHRDALLALREDIPTRSLLNLDALRLGESQAQTQYLKFRGVISIRGDGVRGEDGEVYHNADFLEWEVESSVLNEDEGKKKVGQSQSKTKSSLSNITGSRTKGNGGQTLTVVAPPRTNRRKSSTRQTDLNRQFNTIQSLINPNPVETSSVWSGGARPKTRTPQTPVPPPRTNRRTSSTLQTDLNRQTSTIQYSINPHPVETSSVLLGGARPKTSTQRKKSKKSKKSV